MPIISDPRKQESVMDPAWLRGLRAVGNAIGGDTPESQLATALAPTPLISIYPNVAARAAKTTQFIDDSLKVGPKFRQVAKDFAEQYPRIAAHIKINPTPSAEVRGAAGIQPPYGAVKTRIPMRFTPEGLRWAQTPAGANEVMWHEGTHAAQTLGNSDLRSMYNALDDLGANSAPKTALAQRNNPFEEMAYGQTALRGTQERMAMPTAEGKVVPATAPRLMNRFIQNVPKWADLANKDATRALEWLRGAADYRGWTK